MDNAIITRQLKLGRRVHHAEHGPGEIVGVTCHNRRMSYAVRFRNPDGTWKTSFMSREECTRIPRGVVPRRKAKPKLPVLKEKPCDATEEERKLMQALKLTLKEVREARG